KFLKVSRLIKRRTVANDACGEGLVSVNGRVAKPSCDVAVGDEIEVRFGAKTMRFRVLSVAENVRKNESSEMYEVLS
ncbi:MAG: RNA-binding S4 domain-containing protein, partial [Clostridia bacterium]|nr:RNA-binding S4 domain-containing protein [Clostridia bacterium]